MPYGAFCAAILGEAAATTLYLDLSQGCRLRHLPDTFCSCLPHAPSAAAFIFSVPMSLTFDFHTHHLDAPARAAIINLPHEWMLRPELFVPRVGALYSAGIHPWWTTDANETEQMMGHLPALLRHPQIVALGECGLDALRGAPLETQEAVFIRQIALAETCRKPVTLHIVRTYDRLLHLHKILKPTTVWTVHGFRGKPQLAQQLLAAGFDLSFGRLRNEAAYAATPPERRHDETDDD